MQRRELIRSALGLAALSAVGGESRAEQQTGPGCITMARRAERERVRVAFFITEATPVLNFAGPWEVFQDVTLRNRGARNPFEPFTVAETADAVRLTGGLTVIPDYTILDAPQPHILVVSSRRGSAAATDWIRRTAKTNHLTMSVCTGAFQLCRAGLLEGLTATTHQEFLDALEHDYPATKVVRNVRFVEHDRVATAAGMTAGVDLALRVVERYYGAEVAQSTAQYLAHESEAWRVASRRSSRVQVVA